MVVVNITLQYYSGNCECVDMFGNDEYAEEITHLGSAAASMLC